MAYRTAARGNGAPASQVAVAVALCACLVAVCVLAGCGGGAEGAQTSPTPTAARPSGMPIKVMTWAPETAASALSFPDVPIVARAYADMINSAGGIKGHPLDVLVCDERGEAAAAAECARRAVAEGVVAVVGSFSVNAAEYVPVLETAGVPYLGGTPVSPADFTSRISFPVSGGLPVSSVGAGLLAARQGCRHTALVRQDIEATAPAERYLRAGLAQGGSGLSSVTLLPSGVGDLTSQVAAATDGTDCVAVIAAEQDVQRFLSAFQQSGANQRIIGMASSLTLRVLAQFPAVARTARIADLFPPVGNAVWNRYRTAISASPQRDVVDVNGSVPKNTWAAFETFTRIAAQLPLYDSPTLLSRLNATTALDTDGLVPTLNFRAEFAAPGLARLFDRAMSCQQVKSGALIEPQPGFQDTSPALLAAARG